METHIDEQGRPYQGTQHRNYLIPGSVEMALAEESTRAYDAKRAADSQAGARACAARAGARAIAVRALQSTRAADRMTLAIIPEMKFSVGYWERYATALEEVADTYVRNQRMKLLDD